MVNHNGYKIGFMPNTEFTYEQFEQFLASIYLTVKDNCEIKSPIIVKEAKNLIEILTKNYDLQSPEETILNIRTLESWARPRNLDFLTGISNIVHKTYGIQKGSQEYETIKKLEDLEAFF